MPRSRVSPPGRPPYSRWPMAGAVRRGGFAAAFGRGTGRGGPALPGGGSPGPSATGLQILERYIDTFFGYRPAMP
ncbi:protein of unknown function [Candidatus Methylocalor cossyra]|uniref:Uncharacterized protein n=1 Tax=Candidatus Methylocalor cossyra TaxID=3108543 RepID=A0ABM9NLD1_9GAMM